MFIFRQKNWLKDAEDEINQSHLEEVQREDHQKNLQDYHDQTILQAQHNQGLIFSQRYQGKAKAIEEKVKIAELLTEAEFMKRSMIQGSTITIKSM